MCQDPVAGGPERRPMESECREHRVCDSALGSTGVAPSQTVKGLVSHCFKHCKRYSHSMATGGLTIFCHV